MREAGREGPILDLACGRGRHALACAELGASVLAIDRNKAALESLQARAKERRLDLQCICADLETDRGIPVMPGSCAAILVFRFLFRPLAAAIVQALRPGGLLLYETFTLEQRGLSSGPRNPAFLLARGELPQLFSELEILEFEEILSTGAKPQALARLTARRSVF